MDYEIIKVTAPDKYGIARVQYRTADGSEYWTRYMANYGTPDQAVRSVLEGAAKADAEGRPPGDFSMFSKMNSGFMSGEEMRDYYREFCKGRGYEVDDKMRPHKPAAACPPRQTA